MARLVNSNLGSERSLPAHILLLPRQSALRAAWLVWTQQKQEMSSLNPTWSLQACLWRKSCTRAKFCNKEKIIAASCGKTIGGGGTVIPGLGYIWISNRVLSSQFATFHSARNSLNIYSDGCLICLPLEENTKSILETDSSTEMCIFMGKELRECRLLAH